MNLTKSSLAGSAVAFLCAGAGNDAGLIGVGTTLAICFTGALLLIVGLVSYLNGDSNRCERYHDY